MEFIFKDTGRRRQLTLPVTPKSYQVETGKGVETVHIQALGEVHLAGERTLGTIRVDCMFPAGDYPFSTADRAPYEYIEQLEDWAHAKRPVRFVISGTPINRQVLVEQVAYGERDGTGDVYATLTLREYEAPQAVETVRPPTANKPRAPGPGPLAGAESQTVKVAENEGIRLIAQRVYGQAGAPIVNFIQQANPGKNLRLLAAGDLLHLPGGERAQKILIAAERSGGV